MYQWLPSLREAPAMGRWTRSFYFHQMSIPAPLSWTLVVAVPAAFYQGQLLSFYTKHLMLTLGLAVLACLLAGFLGRRLTSPLARLAEVTTNLPAKLLNHQTIAWPYSRVTDIEALAGNFRSMIDVLQQTVHELQYTNETLESRAGTHGSGNQYQTRPEITHVPRPTSPGRTHGTSPGRPGRDR